VVGRVAALAAILIAAVAVVVVLVGSGGEDYRVKALFQNASQLVKGNLVQVSGTKVGTVEEITLTKDGQAQVTMRIDEKYKPLRDGTKATVRASSLSGIANRYIDLRLPPATAGALPGDVLTQKDTTTAVDLDEIFNIFGPRERKALSGVLRGFSTLYAGREQQANRGLLYLNPSIAATSRLFQELNRNGPELRTFINESAGLVGTVDERRDDLAGLVTNLADTTGALNNRREALAESIQRLPAFMRRSNTTFVNLRATLDDLDPLVDESKPVAKKLRPFLAELRPLARNAVPTLRDLSALVRSPGPGNDLIEATNANVPVRDIALGPVNRNGAQREGAFPASTKALAGATPELAHARPYAVDLTSWFDDFSHSGYYDANGSVGRVALNINAFTFLNGLPTGLIPPNQVAPSFLQLAQTGLNNRCPGSSERNNRDGSNPFKPYPGYNCDETQMPLGP